MKQFYVTLYITLLSISISYAQDIILPSNTQQQSLIASDSSVANGYLETAETLFLQGNYESSNEYYQKAASIYQIIAQNGFSKIWEKYIYCNYSIAWNLHIQQDWEGTFSLLTTTLTVATEKLGERHLQIANIYNGFGELYRKKKDFEKAIYYFLKSLKIKEKQIGREHPKTADTYYNLGIIYDEKTNYDSSLIYHQKALHVYQQNYGKKHFDVSLSHQGIGHLYHKKGDYLKAIEAFNKSLQIVQVLEGNKSPYLASIYYQIGNAEKAQGRFTEALKYYQKSLTANFIDFDDSTDIQQQPSLQFNYYNLGEALNALQGKAETCANIGNEKHDVSQLTLAFKTYQLCEQILTQMSLSYLGEDERVELAIRRDKVYESAIQNCYYLLEQSPESSPQQYLEEVFILMEKRKRSVLHQSILQSNGGKYPSLSHEFNSQESKLQKQIRRQRGLLASKPTTQAKEDTYRASLKSTHEQYQQLQADIQKAAPFYHSIRYFSDITSPYTLQKKLDTSTALLLYHLGETDIYTLMITDKIIKLYTASSPENFMMMNFKNGISYNSDRSYIRFAHELYKKLQLHQLPQSANRLILSTDRDLQHLPLEALLTQPVDKKVLDKEIDFTKLPYLIKKYQLHDIYATVDIDISSFLKSSPSQMKDFAAYAPVFSKSQNEIQNSYTLSAVTYFDEIDSTQYGQLLSNNKYLTPIQFPLSTIEKLDSLFKAKKISSQSYLHQKAQEQHLKEQKSTHLYLGTHTLINNEKPQLSGILMSQWIDNTYEHPSDGILTFQELFKLSMNSEVVILPICESSYTPHLDNLGLLAMQKAFQKANVTQLIHSLWAVPSNASTYLIVGFYHNYFEKQSVQEAVHNIKLRMINESEYAHPYYWSSFTVKYISH